LKINTKRVFGGLSHSDESNPALSRAVPPTCAHTSDGAWILDVTVMMLGVIGAIYQPVITAMAVLSSRWSTVDLQEPEAQPGPQSGGIITFDMSHHSHEAVENHTRRRSGSSRLKSQPLVSVIAATSGSPPDNAN
jgi:hypothetical protein